MTMINITPETATEYIRWARRAKAPYDTLFSRASAGDPLTEDECVTLYTFLLINGRQNRDPEEYERVVNRLRNEGASPA